MKHLEFDFTFRRNELEEGLNIFLQQWLDGHEDVKDFELSRDLIVVLENILDGIN